MTKDLSYCFEPIASRNSEILILGSMPGCESLEAGQYYAHRRNSFWKIMAVLLGFDPESSYETRVKALQSAGVALWDVLQSCKRIGSLDARIEPNTITANDFRTFLRNHERIEAVFFNGSKAESAYMQHVLPTVGTVPLRYARLPSTSPAHASLPFDRKLEAWRVALKPNQRFQRTNRARRRVCPLNLSIGPTIRRPKQ